MPETHVAFPWTDWGGDPALLIVLLLMEGAYLMAVDPVRRRREGARLASLGQVTSFSLGVLVIFLALQSPLHTLSERYLFSAHMTQHLLLTLVAPPLLLLGTPAWMVRRLLSPQPIWRAAFVLTRPAVAFILFNGILAIWHMPSLYDGALRYHDLHYLQHLMFFVTALLMWWPILSPTPDLPRLGYPGQMLYFALLSIAPTVVGAFITFAGTVLYPTYAQAPRVWDISPLTDQQIGGLIMKVPGGLVFWIVLAVIFFRWFKQEEARA